MNSEQVKEYYNKAIKGKYEGNQYEYQRWFSTPQKKAGYDMTRDVITRRFIEQLGSFATYFEVGPGPGTWTKLFLERAPKAEYNLVDISEEMLKNAQENLGNLANIHLTVADATQASLGREHEVFFSSRAIEYIPDKTAFLAMVYKHLVSGGVGAIVTKTPKYGIQKILRRSVPSFHQGQVSPEELRSLLQKAGFVGIEIWPATVVFPGARSAFLDRMLNAVASRFRFSAFSAFFSESYLITFKKP